MEAPWTFIGVFTGHGPALMVVHLLLVAGIILLIAKAAVSSLKAVPTGAQNALDVLPEVSVYLPCRLSVYEEEGKTVLATIGIEDMLQAIDTDEEFKAFMLEIFHKILYSFFIPIKNFSMKVLCCFLQLLRQPWWAGLMTENAWAHLLRPD